MPGGGKKTGPPAVPVGGKEASAEARRTRAALALHGKYGAMKKFKLKAECKTLGLSQDGSEDELRARLIDAATLGVDAVKKRDEEAAAKKAAESAAAGDAKPSVDDLKAKYGGMATFKLKAECKKAGISQDGSGDELKARLVEHFSK